MTKRQISVGAAAATGLAGLAAGAYKGFCDSQDIPISLEAAKAATFGPSAFGFITGAVFGTPLIDNLFQHESEASHDNSLDESVKSAADNKEENTPDAAMTGLSGTIFAMGAATFTAAGYGLGYLIGYLIR